MTFKHLFRLNTLPAMRSRAAGYGVSLALLLCVGACQPKSPNPDVATLAAKIAQTATAQAVGQVGESATATQAVATQPSAVVGEQPTRPPVALNSPTPLPLPAEIASELQSYGIDPTQGDLAWSGLPAAAASTGYLQFKFNNPNLLSSVVTDFALAADVIWNTQYGTAGCGFALRSDGNQEQDEANTYLLALARGGGGVLLFAPVRDGKIQRQSAQYQSSNRNLKIDWQNSASNRVAVVGHGEVFDVFINGQHFDTVVGDLGLLKGFVGFVALQESGDTDCHFENAWLFKLH